MSTLSVTNQDNKILDKFFSQSLYVEKKSNLKKLNSVLKFVFHLKEKNILDDRQLESFVKLSCSIYLEQELEHRIGTSLSRALSKTFSIGLEEEMEI